MRGAREGSLRLKDGRALAYVEAGDLQGQPVIFLHGNPGSRYMRHPDDWLTADLGVRLITPDRPGYGRSDFKRGRTLLDMPADIEQLAESLGLERFAVLGVSAGGPYVAGLCLPAGRAAHGGGDRLGLGALQPHRGHGGRQSGLPHRLQHGHVAGLAVAADDAVA